MGKLSDALEKKQSEKTLDAMMLPTESLSARETQSQSGFDPKLVVCSAPGSIEAENFKVLKAQLLFTKHASKPRTIMITSAFPAEGKTFVATNLAVSIAQGVNHHALLIDCDFHHPNVHKMLGYSNNAGLQEYLTQKRELPDLLINTRVNKLSILTAGSPSANPSELLSSSMMRDFFEEVKERYRDRYIIVDSAPSRVMSEVNVLANFVDGIILVIMAYKSPRQIIKECIEKLGKEKILGIVFNGHDNITSMYGKYQKYYKR